MKNKFVIAIAIVAIVAGAVIAAQALGGHNSKSAFADTGMVASYAANGVTNDVSLGTATVTLSQKTDLVISLTAVSSLITETTVRGNKVVDGEVLPVSESATAGISTWAIVTPLDNAGNPMTDGDMAVPGKIILNKRIQTLSGKLSNVIINCVDPTTGTIPAGCAYDEAEEITLKLHTTSANGFNFLAKNLDQGNYKVEVFAALETDLSTVNQDTNTPDPAAIIGDRTIVVWEVKNPS